MGNIINLPYCEKIPGGVTVGTDVLIRGKVKPNAKSFSINLSAGPKSTDDIIFHFNPRCDENTVVRNTCQNGIWGSEERIGGMVFHRNEEFEIVMSCSTVGYEVEVNQRPFCTYQHRSTSSRVQYFSIGGDVEIRTIQIPSGRNASFFQPPTSQNYYTLPYNEKIPGFCSVGTSVIVRGSVPSNSKRFSINFVPSLSQGSDYILHFNPRYDEGKDVVVRNSFNNGKWGSEERTGGNPLLKNSDFDVHMLVTQESYVVSVNGQLFCTYKHRMAFTSAQYITIAGDVQIKFVQTLGHTDNPPPYSETVPMSVMPRNSQAQPIPGALVPGKIICIGGIPSPSPSSFAIKLMCGPSELGDIAFLLDVRFNSGYDRNQIIRNNRQGGIYGVEERQVPHFPFFPNTPFEIMLLCEPSCIKVAVNGFHYLQFSHRILPTQRADHVIIDGDCAVTKLQIQ